MFPLSKAWGWILVFLQVINAIAAGLTYLSLVPGLPDSLKAKALAANVIVAALVGCLQAVTKALPDEDGDGVPDIFDTKD